MVSSIPPTWELGIRGMNSNSILKDTGKRNALFQKPKTRKGFSQPIKRVVTGSLFPPFLSTTALSLRESPFHLNTISIIQWKGLDSKRRSCSFGWKPCQGVRNHSASDNGSTPRVMVPSSSDHVKRPHISLSRIE